ncbi:class I SAM-dependent methyltransferase [Frigoriflavimonas asaccharolytica]|uniref:SAM-dependent methyltransferase n=1 Tax=Frigoriflavimonas asaccharolytica TaxID=2735899 RepID=A0A8J8G4V3_9FLAO|nr:class I SAM-dependent methyltransferase [Frigoriflavimonas asaccharolytica]NRS91331.1 SAM-dependent methyltransferase [Frigoriflavimonas asaccharolytica]
MKEYPADFWNQFYETPEYVYGTSPNAFFKEQINNLPKGKILFAAEGEGRNAVYAATKLWDVHAFDSSDTGKNKALKLAADNNVEINYVVNDVLNFETKEQFDVIGLFFAHFPTDIRKKAHKHLLQFLKKDGLIIFEAFAKEQYSKSSGGSKNLEMLFSLKEIEEEFLELNFEILEQNTVILAEGERHKGEAEVIQFVGRKI